MIQWHAEMICTAYTPEQYPMGKLPEIALAGRSNVGKSSLINRLISQKLAHVSSAPGMTRSVNFFDVKAPHPFTLVDLPGFGYASRSKGERKDWASLIERYIERREELALVVHLVDIRHGLLEKDRQLQEWLKAIGVPVQVVFTKADKIKASKRKKMILDYVKAGLYSWTLPVAVSVNEPGTIGIFREQMDFYLSTLDYSVLDAE